MPIKQAGMLASRVSTWPRDHFCRSTIAPRPSRPTTWIEFLPISIPITAVTLLCSSVMACSFRWVPPASLLADRGQEHGRTIPLAGFGRVFNDDGARAPADFAGPVSDAVDFRIPDTIAANDKGKSGPNDGAKR